MPLRLPDKLPAIELLKHENIFVMDESRAHKQEIRPLKICVLNLMPLKITTETDLVRLLSNTPLQLEVYFMKLKSHTPKNTPIEHMMMFYKDFQELSKQKFDGMIVTGAPIETMAYEEVEYWSEIKEIFDYERICGNLSGLSYILHDKLTINQQVHCFTHRCCLLYGLSVKNRVVYVKTNIISSKVWNDMEIRVLSI